MNPRPEQRRPFIDFVVSGTPRPKGSLRFVTKDYAKEQNESSPEWRAMVAAAARCVALPEPHDGPVTAFVELYFLPPKKPSAFPHSRRTGDLDKHIRNIFDALVDAGVMRDDSQIVSLVASKRYRSHAGARISLWEEP